MPLFDIQLYDIMNTKLNECNAIRCEYKKKQEFNNNKYCASQYPPSEINELH